ncbi:GlsB/YeaQ/YmgE family stress response membrane protein [Pseudomonadota bacterium]
MNISTDQIIVWLVVGAIAGTLIGALVKRSRKGFGAATNLGIGLIGALIGGLLFKVLKLDLGLGKISVSLEDIVAATAGSILFLLILRFFRNR